MQQKNGLRSTFKGAWCMSHTFFMQQWGVFSSRSPEHPRVDDGDDRLEGPHDQRAHQHAVEHHQPRRYQVGRSLLLLKCLCVQGFEPATERGTKALRRVAGVGETPPGFSGLVKTAERLPVYC